MIYRRTFQMSNIMRMLIESSSYTGLCHLFKHKAEEWSKYLVVNDLESHHSYDKFVGSIRHIGFLRMAFIFLMPKLCMKALKRYFGIFKFFIRNINCLQSWNKTIAYKKIILRPSY